jgi:HK97 gp10 family phage protein
MRITGKANFKSVQQLERNLKLTVEKIERQAKREATSKAATVILKEAKRNTPRRHGHLRKALKRKVSTYKNGEMIIVTIGPDRNYVVSEGTRMIKPVKYAHLVEFGSMHNSPQPYIRPAFDSKKNEALTIYAREIGPAIKRVAKRFNKRRPVS